MDAYLASARQSGELAPPHLRNEDTVRTLVDLGMAEIRTDLAGTRNLARAARTTAQKTSSSWAKGAAFRLAGHVELLAGNARKAVRFYESARGHFSADALERAATAVAMLQALAYTGDYVQAFQVGEEALKTFQENGDEFRAARVRANLGNALHRLDRLEEARAHYEAAMPILAAAQALGDLAIVSRNYAVSLMGLGKLDLADEVYAQARAAFATAEQTSLVLEIDLNRAYLLGRRGRLQEALLAYRRLQTTLPEDLGFELGHCFLDQADFMVEYGLWSDAERAANQAIEIFRRLGVRFELGKSLLLLGMARIGRGKLEEAETALAEAGRRLNRESNLNWRSLLALARADLAEKRGDTRRALRALKQSLMSGPAPERELLVRHRLMDVAISERDLHSAQEAASAGISAAWRSKLARFTGDRIEAERNARQALAEFDQGRQTLGSARLRQAHAAAQERALRECFRSLKDPRDRLEAVARLKSQSLAEVMLATESIPDSDKLRYLREQRQLHASMEEADLDEAWRDAQTFALAEAYQMARLPDVGAETRFVEFFADQGEVYAFVLQSDEVIEHHIGSLEALSKSVRYLRFQLTRNHESSGAEVTPFLVDLGERLLPVLADAPRQLVIGRSSPLDALPWAAIEVLGRPLIERHDLALAPSATVWGAAMSRPRGMGKRSLVTGWADDLAPAIQQEIVRVAEHLGVQPVPTDALEDLSEPCEVIHLAAHGVVREDRPLFSAMLLGSASLTAFDILHRRIAADLVVLSGCTTGVSVPGDTPDTEGLIEALLAAGTPTVVASLWQVHDVATSRWMDIFYRQRAAGVPEAYRAACLTAREEYPHPGLWAPFAVFGRLN